MHNFKKYVAQVVLAGAVCAMTLPAQAGPVTFKTPSQLKDACMARHGDFSAPGQAGVYSCQFRGGAVIACGGKGDFARTCESSAPKTILNPLLVRAGDFGPAADVTLRAPVRPSPVFRDQDDY
jgi:hypothetical protein